jgi:hypothetical protein
VKRLLGRLLVAATTFCLSLSIEAPSSSVPSPQSTAELLYAVVLGINLSDASRPINTPVDPHISQQSTVRFPNIGNVRVRAHEDFGTAPQLTFIEQKSGRQILSVYVGRFDWPWEKTGLGAQMNPRLRFKTLSIKGLPDPLLIGIAMSPGGSDSDWVAVAVGEVNGDLEVLTYETMETCEDGGFFFGDLGQGVGVGAAQWSFVWGEDEGHPPPHKYQVKMFKWNGWRFEWHKVLRTRRKHDSADAALRAYGFRFKDVRLGFSEWTDLQEW